jgi:hypothetical protein
VSMAMSLSLSLSAGWTGFAEVVERLRMLLRKRVLFRDGVCGVCSFDKTDVWGRFAAGCPIRCRIRSRVSLLREIRWRRAVEFRIGGARRRALGFLGREKRDPIVFECGRIGQLVLCAFVLRFRWGWKRRAVRVLALSVRHVEDIVGKIYRT